MRPALLVAVTRGKRRYDFTSHVIANPALLSPLDPGEQPLQS
jgi:hypothetical protein